jgi:hypothetical protein
MKYMYCLLVGFLITNNSFSIDTCRANGNVNRPNMVHTLPIDSAARFEQRMELIHQERARRAIVLQERRLQNIENYIVSTQVGPTMPFVPVR